jgi:hypothetical protein
MNARLALASTSAMVAAFLGMNFWYYQTYSLEITDPAFFAKTFAQRLAWMSAWVAVWSWFSYSINGHAQIRQNIALTAAAGLVDVTIVLLAVPWVFFAMGWPWPNAFHEIMRTVLVILVALVQLRLVWGFLNKRLVLLWALAGCVALGVIGLQNWAEQNDTASLKSLPYEGNIYPAYWVMPAEPNLDTGLDELWNEAGWGRVK